MASVETVANAVGGKTARACDGCIRRRARWFCAADDAFLCQSCDASVHSANPLARRHERVRLKTSSFKSSDETTPSWHMGFTRKARTPRRHGKKRKSEVYVGRNLIPFVPEAGADDTTSSHEENYEEQELLYRVPTLNDVAASTTSVSGNEFEDFSTLVLPSEKDLAEFSADVESLLGKGLENESYGIEGLGLMEDEAGNNNNNDKKKSFSMEFCCLDAGKVKVEDDAVVCCREIDEMGRDQFEISFDYDSLCGDREEEQEQEQDEEEEKPKIVTISIEEDKEDQDLKTKEKKKKKLLRLDYEAVMTEWSSHGELPWFTGERPQADSIHAWPQCMGGYGTELLNPYGHFTGMGGHGATGGDGGREARVSRYREKRRTRLFSKKIRYEVRKLNAEKRPRVKGRFVKRAAFPAAAPMPFPLTNKKK